MGIESDRLVLDYLSRVGDLAQTALPASERMRLVAQLRNDIDRARDRTAGDSPAAVRRILGRLGSPDELVESASASSAASAPPPGPYTAPAAPPPAAPPSAPPMPPAPPQAGPGPAGPAPAGPGPEAPAGDGPRVPGPAAGRPRDAAGPSVNDLLTKRPADPGAAPGAAPGGPFAPQGGSRANEVLGGWTGGLIMSEFEPPAAPPPAGAPPADPAAAAAVPPPPPVPPAPARGRLRVPRIRLRPAPPPVAVAAPAAPARRGIPTGPVEVLAAGLLVAGAVMTNLILLLAGWLLAYTTRGITRKQASFAALVLPGTVMVCGLVWLWGRTTGHWGAALSQAQMGGALTADLPVMLRVAAGVSAAYLLWRGVVRRG